MGLIGIVISLVIPALSGAREVARKQSSVANLRSLGVLVHAYASENADFPPVSFAPVYGNKGDDPQVIEAVDGTPLPGYWFNNSTLPHARYDEPPPIEVLRDPAAVGLDEMVGPMRYFSDYKLADCLYATPRYWDRDTQTGVDQWKAQRLNTIAFPSDKGFAKQMMVYHVEGYRGGYPACCVEEVDSAVLWADLSGTSEVQASLRPGVPNFWHHGRDGRVSIWAQGVPIDATQDGVLGRDR